MKTHTHTHVCTHSHTHTHTHAHQSANSLPQVAGGGAAEKSQKLFVGQRILEVNGVSLLGASHMEAVKTLRNAPDKLYITVCDGYDPQEVLRRQSESDAAAVSDSRSAGDDTCTIDRSMGEW